MIGTKVKTLPSGGCLYQEPKEQQRLQGALELMQMNKQLRFTRSLSLQAPFPCLHHYNFILWNEEQILTHPCLTFPRQKWMLAQDRELHWWPSLHQPASTHELLRPALLPPCPRGCVPYLRLVCLCFFFSF